MKNNYHSGHKTRFLFICIINLRRLEPVLVLAFGFLFMLRGINPGIPYLSPKVVMEQHGIKSCCSHKK